MFRTEVGKNITARLTPTLEFIADGIPENAAHDRLAAARGAGAGRRGGSARVHAQYAGDEDPYVKPREIDEDDEDEEL